MTFGFSIQKLVFALGIGAMGGGVAHFLDLPLAWMIGAMGATIAASLSGVPVHIPMGLRTVFLSILGAFLGSSFTDQTLSRAGDWPISLASVVLFVLVITCLGSLYYRHIAKLDSITALFGATPGGLTPMVVIGAESGGVEQHITLVQGLRVVLVVFFIPALVFGLLGYDHPPSAETNLFDFHAQDAIWLGGGVAMGVLLAIKVKLPAPHLTGAMFASAALHMGGVVEQGLPYGLLEITLWVLGSAIGSRFSGLPLKNLVKLAGHAAILVIGVLGATSLVAWALSGLLGIDFLTLFLALAPGGVAEMCLIALALNVDPAFVALHHLIRITLILISAPLIGRALARRHKIVTSRL